MSFRGTRSALSINGYQSFDLGPAWRNVQTFSETRAPGIENPAFNATGEYLAFRVGNSPDNTTEQVNIYYNPGLTSTWTLQQSITMTAVQDFGTSISFSDDGSYIAIGAPRANTSPYSSNGAVYIYTRSGTTWTLQQTLLASDRRSNDAFGTDVSFDGGANYIAIGTPLEDTSPYTDNGAAYIFTRSGTTWSQTQKILSPSGTIGNTDKFGSSLQFSQNGQYLIVGAPGNDNGQTQFYDLGLACVYSKSGSTWVLSNQLAGTGQTPGCQFGRNVGIDNTGDNLFVRGTSSPRYIWFFSKSGSDWPETQYINFVGYTNPSLINQSSDKSTAMSGDAQSLILGLYVNSRTIAIDKYPVQYEITQELYDPITSYAGTYGIDVAMARSNNVAAVTAGDTAGVAEYLFVFVRP